VKLLESLESLSGTNIPTILIIGGIGFLLLSIADKVYGELRVSRTNRKYALTLGLFLLISGLGIEVFGPEPRDDGPNNGNGASAPEWRKWKFHAGANPSFNCLIYRGYAKERSDPWTDVICMNKALADADQFMGDNYKAFRNSRSPDQIPAVKREQRDWIKARNRTCPAAWSDLDTYALVEVIADCLREQTQKRTKFFVDSMQPQ